MRTIAIDTKLIDELGDLSKVIDLCDASDRIVATVVSAPDAPQIVDRRPRRGPGRRMRRITLDLELRQLLGDLSEPVWLCDAADRPIAQIVPAPADQYERLGIRSERNRTSPETEIWYTSEQVFAMLRRLEAEYS